MKILYVDDEPLLLEVIKIFLEAKGSFHVETAISAREALNLVSKYDYDVIISDCQMSHMNGFDFFKIIRKNHGNIPFIFFSGKEIKQVVNDEFTFYIQKDNNFIVILDNLMEKIRQNIEKNRKKRDI
jgi:CheY-like chemotaxis protein